MGLKTKAWKPEWLHILQPHEKFTFFTVKIIMSVGLEILGHRERTLSPRDIGRVPFKLQTLPDHSECLLVNFF